MLPKISQDRRQVVQRIIVNHVDAPKKKFKELLHHGNIRFYGDQKATKGAELQGTEHKNTARLGPQLLEEYLSDSSLHGVKYIGNLAIRSGIIGKLFWIIIMICSFLFLAWMVNTFWNRYQANPVRTIIENFQAPIFQAPFPAVTICPLVPPLPMRRAQLLNKFKLPHGMDNKTANFLLKYATAFANERIPSGAKMHLLNLKTLLRTNHMSLIEMLTFLRPCQDILEGCWWDGGKKNCSELFKESFTNSGVCCSFNYLLEDYINYVNIDSTERIHIDLLKTAYFGSTSGLAVTLNRNLLHVENDTSEETIRYSTNSVGVLVFCHHPLEYIDAIATRHLLQAQDELRIGVSPFVKKVLTYNHYENDDPEANELCASINTTLKYFPAYLYSNCFTSCSIDISLTSCGCLPFYYAPVANKYKIRICEWEDFACLYANIDSIRVIHDIENANFSCVCQNPCEDVNYDTEMSSGHLNRQEFNAAPVQKNLTADQAILRIYMLSETFVVANIVPIADELYLLASMGGIFSLFVGCSFISLVELFYFIGLFFRSYRNSKKSK